MWIAKALIIFNKLYDLSTGGSKRPVVFDIDQNYPQLRILDRGFESIQREAKNLLSEKQAIPRYHDLDKMQTKISAGGEDHQNWKVFYLYAMGERPEANRASCPRTAALLDQVPGVFQAFFSILEGGKSVPAHEGPYRGYLRYHLGLIVPRDNPPSIRIKDRVHTWQEGKSILFDDSWDHEVYNKSKEDRVVLIVDIRRPMPFPLNAINLIVERFIQVLYGKKILKQLA